MSRSRRHLRSGQSLVEFAVVALVMYMLLAAILTFGHALYVAQGLQGAADLAAREISRTPLGVGLESLDRDGRTDGDTSYALMEDIVRLRIYDDAYLVIDLADFFASFTPPEGEQPSVFKHLVPQLPLLNQQLVSLMIVDRPVIDGEQRQLLRYPGTIISRLEGATPPADVTYPSWVQTDLTVDIPLINSDDSIQWVGVVEEIESDASPDPFRIDSDQGGIVALRINYPFQSASMSSFRPNAAEPFEPTIGQPNAADDGAVIESGGLYAGTYGGKYGLGAQGAFGQTVRPYRRVISAQAIYRREVFE